jgi:hypothetical protein
MSATIVNVEFCSPRTGIIEIVEVSETRDERFADGTRPLKPDGEGWELLDFEDEHATTWTRIRVIPLRGRRP